LSKSGKNNDEHNTSAATLFIGEAESAFTEEIENEDCTMNDNSISRFSI